MWKKIIKFPIVEKKFYLMLYLTSIWEFLFVLYTRVPSCYIKLVLIILVIHDNSKSAPTFSRLSEMLKFRDLHFVNFQTQTEQNWYFCLRSAMQKSTNEHQSFTNSPYKKFKKKHPQFQFVSIQTSNITAFIATNPYITSSSILCICLPFSLTS